MEQVSFNVGAIDKLLKRFIAIWLCVLMFSSVAGETSVKKCAIIGQAAKLFSIDNNSSRELSLYNKTEIRIASWTGTTYTVAHIDPHYSGKIFMDKKRNIWIFDVEKKDAGKYFLKFGIQIERHEIILIVMEELTEKQPQECSNNHPEFTKEGNLSGQQIGQIRKWLDNHPEYIKEYLEKVMPEQILQMLACNHPKEVLKESSGSCNPLFLGLLIVACITGIVTVILLYLLLTDRIKIREGLKNTKDGIQKKLCCRHKFENEPREPQDTVIGNKEPEVHDIQVPLLLVPCPTSHIVTVETIPKLPQPSKTNKSMMPRKDDTVHTDILPPTCNDEQNSNQISQKSTARTLEGHDSDSDDEQNALLRDSADQNENEDGFHPIEQRRKPIHIRETAGNVISRDSESNDEHIELLSNRACGSNFAINESEDDFHQMGQEKKKIHIRETEG